MRNGACLLLAVVLSVALAGCGMLAAHSGGPKFNDDGITQAVKTKLDADHALTTVDVDTVNRIVYLTGTVPDEQCEQRATEIAKSIRGVNKVVDDLDTTD